MTMQMRQVGKTDIKVSEINLGCWTLGGLNWVNGSPNGWANVDEDEAIKAIHYAMDQGVNHFDNADVYGNGRAERMLAKALGSKSTEVVVATKVGHFPGTAEHAYDALHVRHQCEQSLRNLNRDYIDIYYFHHGDFGPDDKYVDAAVETVNKLKQEGKIRAIGLSAYSDNDFLRLVPKIIPAVLQSWAHAMSDGFIRKGSPVQQLLEKEGMSFVTFSPLAQGLLLGKYDKKNPPTFDEGDHRKGSKSFSAENLEKLEPKIEKLKSRFGSEIRDLSRMALQYNLHSPEVCCVIPGFRNQRQVETNLWADGKPLTDEDMVFIRETLA
jgi:aryl-alcohol dehydrogenase-like predicted oxidoreductase